VVLLRSNIFHHCYGRCYEPLVWRCGGLVYRRSFELPVKRARSFDRRSNVPGLMIGTGQKCSK